MAIIKYPSDIDVSKYTPDLTTTETKFGLPATVAYCKRCVISNQRPNSSVEYQHTEGSKKNTINFDEHGICDACRVREQKTNKINWDEREKELHELCNEFRKNDGSYDCLLPGSGGKDSFYASHILKNKFGMHPLTVTWAPHMYTDWGWKNFQSWIHAGHDNHLITPNGRIHRLLTRLAVDKLLHPFQPFILGQKSLAPKIAEELNIPLVFYGENEAEYGNPIEDTERSLRDWAYFTSDNKDNIYISGTSLSELKEDFYVTDNDILPYMPADPNKLQEKNIVVHYLGYYLKWHPQSCYYYAVENGGFIASPERTAGTYSKYNSIDDKIDDFHYYTTGVKFGIGRATYDASQEIRSDDITREEGVALVKRFDHEWPDRFADEVFNYLSMDEKHFSQIQHMFESPIMDKTYFDKLCDNNRSPHLWMYKDNKWQLRHELK